MNSNMKWGSREIIRFLDIYAMHRCLWDFNHKDYKNKERRVVALKTILRDLNIEGLTMTELQGKIHTIRTTYTNELRKIQASKTSRNGTNRVYKTKLSWFKLADSFLREIVYRRKGCTTQDEDKENEEDENKHGLVDTSTKQPESSPTSNINNISDSVSLPSSSNGLRSSQFAKKRHFDEPFHLIEKTVQALRSVTEQLEEEDEIGSFCKSIMKQMRKLPEEYNVDLMEEIQSLITYKRKCFLAERQRKEQSHPEQLVAAEEILGREEQLSE